MSLPRFSFFYTLYCIVITAVLTSILSVSALAEIKQVNPETPKPIIREQKVIILLDIFVDETGKPVNVIFSEGQADMGLLGEHAIKQVYQQSFPKKQVDGKPVSYWLRNVEHVAAKLKTVNSTGPDL